MLEAVNGRLKAGRVGVSLEQRGDRLYLVATLPPKPNSGKSKPYQQRIALGIRANPAGFKQAELEAKRLGVQLAEGSFSWDKQTEELTVRDAIAQFEKQYFSERERNGKTLTTFNGNYLNPFKKLPLDEVLTVALMVKTIKETEPNTRTRQLACRAFKSLGALFNLEIDTSKLQGDYGLKRVNPKNLPSDQEIQEAIKLLPDSSYQWAYGLMATYGLRNHECFFIDHDLLKDKGICLVLEGKTGGRKVYPLYPEWLDLFDLQNVRVPLVSGKTNRDYGQRITQYFKRHKIPFSPYCLRHSWARRAIDMRLDAQLAAKQMGHSYIVHVTIYAEWFDDSVHQRAFEKILNDPNRIKPF